MPIYNKMILNLVKYWVKFIELDSNKYVRNIYDMMLNDIEQHPDKSSWAKHVKEILERLGLSDAWIFQTLGNTNVFLNCVKLRIKDQYLQNWNEEINSSSRARSYRLFYNFRLQPYLDIVTFKNTELH